ncbi:MAG TPA: hypothetical protein VNO26_02875 [Candidatus Limnocylindria bacterium]|nr:hypothetical protein [Candidatus Limnocylindria bacterium]
MTAFVALGAVVIVGRSLKGAWSLLRPEPREVTPPSVPVTYREHRAA